MMFKKAATILLSGVLVFGAYKLISDNQAKADAQLIERAEQCEFQIGKAKKYVSLSPSLIKLINEKVANPKLAQPSAARGYKEGQEYLLISEKFPKLDVTKQIPQVLAVRSKSFDFQNKQVIVSSDCTPESFTVKLGDLYEVFQTVDYY
ncbi:hypothetical protein FNW02_33840 [Komarekiella sp. 'clone 1']|uniref:Uncharacterized protein n=1 Tax=Komarekiella delphini-convector SJRDD-AB1 TaxID=2593771 RepID=A0AA40T4R2_9NOST|nr:hypothetical protein [Komarekiella delphini-convector]MBD6620620.1 hypothetical protein [Komarekiella delphini-convector SJRDD-AB1]